MENFQIQKEYLILVKENTRSRGHQEKVPAKTTDILMS